LLITEKQIEKYVCHEREEMPKHIEEVPTRNKRKKDKGESREAAKDRRTRREQ
jgi:hypothetical protein